MDAVFGPENFRSEVIWRRTNARSTSGKWPRLHDVLLHFARSDDAIFNAALVPADDRKMLHTLITGANGEKYQTFELTAPGATQDGESGRPWRGFDPNRYGRHWANAHSTMNAWNAAGLIHWPKSGKAGGFPRRRGEEPFVAAARMITVGDVWNDVDRLNQTAKERLGYPTVQSFAGVTGFVHRNNNRIRLACHPLWTEVHARFVEARQEAERAVPGAVVKRMNPFRLLRRPAEYIT